MYGWLLRALLVFGGVIAAWLVGRDAPNFTFVQTVVTLLLITVVVALLALWPRRRRSARRDEDAG